MRPSNDQFTHCIPPTMAQRLDALLQNPITVDSAHAPSPPPSQILNFLSTCPPSARVLLLRQITHHMPQLQPHITLHGKFLSSPPMCFELPTKPFSMRQRPHQLRRMIILLQRTHPRDNPIPTVPVPRWENDPQSPSPSILGSPD